MRVVHLSTSDSGGAGIAAARLHKAMLLKGVNSFFLTMHKFTEGIPMHFKFRPGDSSSFPAIVNAKYKIRKALQHYGIRYMKHERVSRRHLAGRAPGFEHFSFPFSEFDLSKHPLVVTADIIHLHWVSDGFVDYRTFFKGNHKNIVWTLHDMNPFTGGCHHSDGSFEFRTNCLPCHQLAGTIDKNYASEILFEKKSSLSGINSSQLKIVTPSVWLGELSQSGILFNRFSHDVIPNAFSTTEFYPEERKEARAKLGLPAGKKIILFNSHHIDNPRKGLSFLLKAAEMLERDDVVLCAAGNKMSDDMYPQLINLGYLQSEEQMRMAYSAADLFVLPSLAENYPNTVCESLLCGTPVAGFNVGGMSELITNDNGRLVNSGDVTGLSGSIDEILNSEFDRNTIHSAAAKSFDRKIVADKYLTLYKSYID